MAPKNEQMFGGIGGMICIAAIILAIVFGILWGQQRDKRRCLSKCGEPLSDNVVACPPTSTTCIPNFSTCYAKCDL
jgi:hypothetical protein